MDDFGTCRCMDIDKGRNINTKIMADKRITREIYLAVRKSLEIDEEFIYNVYLDSNPDKPLEFKQYIAYLDNFLYAIHMNINDLLRMMINYYDAYFTIVLLKSRDGSILKIF
jgi:hypothetical protein